MAHVIDNAGATTFVRLPFGRHFLFLVNIKRGDGATNGASTVIANTGLGRILGGCSQVEGDASAERLGTFINTTDLVAMDGAMDFAGDSSSPDTLRMLGAFVGTG